jgi:hypothetical protein
MWSFLLVVVVALVLGAPVPGVWAQDDDDDDDDDDGPIVLEEAKVIIETNFTDGDAGLQIFFDGEAWKKMKIKDPNGKSVFDVKGKGGLKELGLTELFLESEEPNFLEDLTLPEILELLPAGLYTFKGKTAEGDKVTGEATLSHDLPCAAVLGEPFDVDGAIVPSAGPVVITWAPVTTTLNSDGDDCAATAITVETYQVIVENETPNGSFGNEFSVFLPEMGAGNQVTVPAEFIEANSTFKFEVLAIADNGNQTIVETWFCTDLAACPEPD